MSSTDYGYSYAQRQIARSQNPVRKFIKGFYLRNVLNDVVGPTIDFGCGAGQLLSRLPKGSIGLEVNKFLVKALQNQGLNAQLYQPEIDQLTFRELPIDTFHTLVMSHVLEHFEDAASGLKTILESSRRLNFQRVIAIVPGKKGYSFDSTHRTFVTRHYLEESDLMRYAGFKARHFSYFPINKRSVGDYFTFHELKIIFDATE